jgi:hypothetical protein
LGREVRCSGIFNGASSEGQAQLETDFVLWRGEERAKIPFASLASVDVRDGWLHLKGADGSLALHLGSPESERWAQAILHPKTIVERMGLKAGMRVSLLGVDDPDFLRLVAAVGSDRSPRKRKDSDAIVVRVERARDLQKTRGLESYIKRDGMIWVVSPKGKKNLNENHIYAHMRSLGLKDVKTARFSATHTANKFIIPKDRR